MKKNTRKIYVVGGDVNYANWILPLGFELTDKKEEATCAFFTGGSDVSPWVYNEPWGSYLGCNEARDKQELEFFAYFMLRNIPMIGVCRGGQFLSAASGAKICQHMEHPYLHETVTFDGQRLESTSTHHNQFLIEPNIAGLNDFELLGWAENLSPMHLDGNDQDYNFPKDYKEPEIVFYPKSRSFACQMHPEFFPLDHPTIRYLQKLFMRKVFRENI